MADEEYSNSPESFKAYLKLKLERFQIYLQIFSVKEAEGVEVFGRWGEFRTESQRTMDSMTEGNEWGGVPQGAVRGEGNEDNEAPEGFGATADSGDVMSSLFGPEMLGEISPLERKWFLGEHGRGHVHSISEKCMDIGG